MLVLYLSSNASKKRIPEKEGLTEKFSSDDPNQ
jgi:hypothetical protein